MSQSSKLTELLGFLDRSDVSEVLLQTDSPPCVMIAGQVRPLSKAPLGPSELRALLAGTTAAEAAAAASNQSVFTATMQTAGKEYSVSSFIRQGRLQLRISAVSKPASSIGKSSTATSDGATAPNRALRDVLIAARERRASDVHITSDSPAMVRIAGELKPVGSAMSYEQVEAILLPLLDISRKDQLDELGYADLASNIEGRRVACASISTAGEKD